MGFKKLYGTERVGRDNTIHARKMESGNNIHDTKMNEQQKKKMKVKKNLGMLLREKHYAIFMILLFFLLPTHVNGSKKSFEVVNALGWRQLFFMLDDQDLLKLYMVSKHVNKNLKYYVTLINRIFPNEAYSDNTFEIKMFYPVIQKLVEADAINCTKIFSVIKLDWSRVNVLLMFYDKEKEELLKKIESPNKFEDIRDDNKNLSFPEVDFEWGGEDLSKTKEYVGENVYRIFLVRDNEHERKILQNSALDIYHSIEHQEVRFRHRNYFISQRLENVQSLKIFDCGFLVIIKTEDKKGKMLVLTNDIIEYISANKDPDGWYNKDIFDEVLMNKLTFPEELSKEEINKIEQIDNGTIWTTTIEMKKTMFKQNMIFRMRLEIYPEKFTEFVISGNGFEWYKDNSGNGIEWYKRIPIDFD